MKTTFNEKLVAYMALISGLAISAVAVYYSVVGLTAIFAAAFWPIVIMGTTLEVSKLVAASWLKQNWDFAPKSMRAYLVIAVVVLMLITSMGIFGFLSRAHLDQGIPTGDVAAKVALLDEKIKTERDNIDSAKKALSQMDSQVDQMLGRTTDSRGANRAVQIRKQQSKERKLLQSDIAQSQKIIAQLNEERAPIASQLRKVEAEVGPIKYIAAFFYGETDSAILEKAVTWVILIIIFVFDPLAVILLLASQASFQEFRRREQNDADETKEFFDRGKELAKQLDDNNGIWPVPPAEQKELDPLELWNQILTAAEKQTKVKNPQELESKPHVWTTTVYPPVDGRNVKDDEDAGMNEDAELENTPTEENTITDEKTVPTPVQTVDWTNIPVDQEYVTIDGQKMSMKAARELYPQTPLNKISEGYVQNEEQSESNLWQNITNGTRITEDEYHERALENSIDEYVASVREGRLPLYKVPYEIRDQVQERLLK